MHIITGLGVGGAEIVLVRLLKEMDLNRFSVIVCSMTAPGPVADQIRDLGIEVFSLEMARGIADLRAIPMLRRKIRDWRPDLIQTWMYHANLLGGFVGKLAGIPVLWSIHHTNLQLGSDKRLTIRVAQFCSRVSAWLPTRIICCAESSRLIHARMGYFASKMIVIPNGFDLLHYKPEPKSDALCWERFGIPPEAEVVSLVARFHPQKDHANFLAAAGLFRKTFPNARFVLCGDGISEENQDLAALIDANGLRGSVLLLGRRTTEEVALLMARSILTTSASRGEAFPNVLGEAMACATVCVATDVGDCAYVIGDAGIVVKPGSPAALAEGWMKVMMMSTEERRAIGFAARSRVEQNFAIQSVVSRYQEVYLECARP